MNLTFFINLICFDMILSQSLENTINLLSRLPGVGRKTAFRYALSLLESQDNLALELADAIVKMKSITITCNKCNALNDQPTCSICQDPMRDPTKICVVANIKDLLAIEQTEQYQGMYHVLGGLISPIDGVGPNDLSFDMLESRIKSNENTELIMALNSSVEGDTTIYYIFKRFENLPVTVSIISRGVSIGAELDYTDPLTLTRSIQTRQPYQSIISS